MGKSSAEAQSRSVAGPLFSGILFIGAPLAAFWIGAALLVSLGLSRWGAGLVAGVILIVPLLWHLLGERKRADASTKALLSGGDRLGLRMLVVASVALAVMFGGFRGRTVTAVKAHYDWPLHGSSSGTQFTGWRPSELLGLVPSANRVVMVDTRAGGKSWSRWLDSVLPERLRGLDFDTIVWTREAVALISRHDLVKQLDARAKADERSLPVLGQGRYWSKRGRAAYVSPTYMVWGSDVSWVQAVADGKQRHRNADLERPAARVKPGAMLVLLDTDGDWLGIPGIGDTAIAFYRSGSRIRIEASIRYPNDPPYIHVRVNIRSLVARADGTADRDGLPPAGKTPGLTIRREGKMIYAQLIRPAAEIEALMTRAQKTGSVDSDR